MSEEVLNNYIERLQADASPRAVAVAGWQQGGIEATILHMASHLNSLRPGANVADEGFIARLRERVREEAASRSDLSR